MQTACLQEPALKFCPGLLGSALAYKQVLRLLHQLSQSAPDLAHRACHLLKGSLIRQPGWRHC